MFCLMICSIIISSFWNSLKIKKGGSWYTGAYELKTEVKLSSKKK